MTKQDYIQTQIEKIPDMVAKGVERLDAVCDSDWRSKIDLESLDMFSHDNCILGQIFGSFAYGVRQTFKNETFLSYKEHSHQNAPWHYGFSHSWDTSVVDMPRHRDESNELSAPFFEALTKTWKQTLSQS